MWDPDEIREKLKKRDLDIVEDLGADDEDLLQLAWEYEMEFEIKISDEEARRATQFSQIVKLIQQKLSG
ncbi:acyl carrier protein [Patescibacteria group bacterium]|nr:acyl carrier protein [Patescibacteria group bacterium]